MNSMNINFTEDGFGRFIFTGKNPVHNDLYVGTEGKHQHYYKDVSKLNTIDIYRVLELFEVSNPCLQHAIKKLLVAGGRGAGKNIDQDIQEAIDSLERWQEMRDEDGY